jgi:hypothetical protein
MIGKITGKMGVVEGDFYMTSNRAVKPLTLLSIAQLGNLLGVKAEEEVLAALVRKGLCSAAKRAGYLVVPDIVPEYVSISGSDIITIIRQGYNETLSPSYPSAHLLIELGMSIAMGNGSYELSEIRQLSYVMERNFGFSNIDIRALTALKDFSALYPPDIGKVIEKLLKKFPLDVCQDIARTMVTVGAAGSIGSGKIITLRRMYEALELDEGALYQLMMSFRYSESGIIEVAPVFEFETLKGESMLDPTIKLDLALVATKKRETESVGMLLSEIFASED